MSRTAWAPWPMGRRICPCITSILASLGMTMAEPAQRPKQLDTIASSAFADL